MSYERKELICYMLGNIHGKKGFEISADDSLIILDQILQRMNQLPINAEEKEVISRMHEQMEIFNIQMGLNRTSQRKIGIRKRS